MVNSPTNSRAQWFGGLAFGVGVGSLNASLLGFPEWVNLATMLLFAGIYTAEVAR